VALGHQAYAAAKERVEDSLLVAVALVAVSAAYESAEVLGGSAFGQEDRVGDLEATAPSRSGFGCPDLVLVPIVGDELGGAESVTDACKDGRGHGRGLSWVA
jgi:hypothetical protein